MAGQKNIKYQKSYSRITLTAVNLRNMKACF